MGSLTRADLELLLHKHKLGDTLPSMFPKPQECGMDVLPTGLAPLDCLLGGGFPRGQLSEVTGPHSTGRTSVIYTLLATTMARGELVALVDTLDTFDPTSDATAWVDLSKLLWIRGSCEPTADMGIRSIDEQKWNLTDTLNSSSLKEDSRMVHALNRALKALRLVINVGGFSVVVMDLVDIPISTIRQVPFTTWLRLSRMIEDSKTACMLLAAKPIARSPAGYTIAMQSVRSGGRWIGKSDRSRVFFGLEVQARVLRTRRRNMETSCRLSVNCSDFNLTAS